MLFVELAFLGRLAPLNHNIDIAADLALNYGHATHG